MRVMHVRECAFIALGVDWLRRNSRKVLLGGGPGRGNSRPSSAAGWSPADCWARHAAKRREGALRYSQNMSKLAGTRANWRWEHGSKEGSKEEGGQEVDA
jgi:hypothetical protein